MLLNWAKLVVGISSCCLISVRRLIWELNVLTLEDICGAEATSHQVSLEVWAALAILMISFRMAAGLEGRISSKNTWI